MDALCKNHGRQGQEQELLHDEYVSPIPAELQWRNWAADSEGITGEALQVFVDQTLFRTLKNQNALDPRSYMVREVLHFPLSLSKKNCGV